jgi:hypothetical protein
MEKEEMPLSIFGEIGNCWTRPESDAFSSRFFLFGNAEDVLC